jgi:hypothetical protein
MADPTGKITGFNPPSGTAETANSKFKVKVTAAIAVPKNADQDYRFVLMLTQDGINGGYVAQQIVPKGGNNVISAPLEFIEAAGGKSSATATLQAFGVTTLKPVAFAPAHADYPVK